MKWKNLVLLTVLLLLPCVCMAQSEKVNASKAPKVPKAPKESKEPAAIDPSKEEKVPLEGDVVVFKKGTELRGVRVVRQSPMFVEIEYLPGEPYLKIPTTQVANVIYAEKNDKNLPNKEGLTLGPDIMPGEEVSAEFHRALTSVISEELLAYKNEDYIDVVTNLCNKAGVEVSVDENLKALPKEERSFSLEVPARTTLLDFLRRDLADIAPGVRVILQFDKLVLQKRTAESMPPMEDAKDTPGKDNPPDSAPASPPVK
jgi:hypothetical protein